MRSLTILLTLLCQQPAACCSSDRPDGNPRTAAHRLSGRLRRGRARQLAARSPVRRSTESYVLWPDLRATYLRATLTNADHDEINAFLSHYGVLKPARELRYQFALHLMAEDRMSEYLDLYRQFYQGLEIEKLDCLALQAEIEAGQENRVTRRAQDLWLVGRSQADECDPVFEHLRSRNLLMNSLYVDRFDLAIKSKRFSLARYLARSLDDNYLEMANEWLSAQNEPEEFLANVS